MHLEVSSLLARLRIRPNNSAAETLTTTTTLADKDAVPDGPDLQLVQAFSSVGQKILQDPDSYIDSGESQDPAPNLEKHGGGVGLPHPRRSRPISMCVSGTDKHCVPITAHTGSDDSASKSGSAREWATFGRRRKREAGNLSSLSQTSPSFLAHSPSPRRHRGKTNGTTTNVTQEHVGYFWNASRPSVTSCELRPSSPSVKSARESRANRSSGGRTSPTDTMSSKQVARLDHATCPTPLSTVHSTSSRARGLGSGTFGYPTPPNHRPRFHSPPPLPSLDHPGLADLISAGNKAVDTTQTAFVDRSNTPSRRLSHPRSLMRTTFGRPHHASFPGIRQIFDAQEQGQKDESPQPTDKRRTRTISERPQNLRRTSAEWSAQQAVSGVTSRSNQAWPAGVSREILRLSLGEWQDYQPEDVRNDLGSGAKSISGSSAKHKKQTRGHSVDDHPDQALISPSLSPFPSPPPARLPAPLNEPVALSDGRAPSSRIKRSSPSFFRHSFGDPRDSGMATEKMAEVKRSLSAVEPRHVPKRATSTSHDPSPLGRSTSAIQTPAKNHLLHPYSTITPLRAVILQGPSTPSTSGTSRAADEVPGTPTPAPKYRSDKSRGKRKADDIDTTPPDQKEGQRATFAIPSETRSQRISNSSHAPSSYHRKRAKLTSTSPFATPTHSRPPSTQEPLASNSKHLAWPGGPSYRGPPRTPSRVASIRSQQPDQRLSNTYTKSHDRRQSMSQASIPISALISPHVPSIATSTKFHMRDPRKPPKKLKDTEWGLRFASEDEAGSPPHAWLFFIGFVLFPLWWVAALCIPVPRTRTAGDASLEKAVTVIDDPQIEHDAKSWRFRCRVVAVVSLLTYIPFIVLVAIFVPK